MGTDINFKKHLGRTYGTHISLPANIIDPVPAIVAAFEARVLADSGVTEATSCLTAQLNALNAIQ